MSGESSIDGLTSKEVVEQVFARLKEGRVLREVVFPEGASALIGDDSDWHRTRMGFMRYDSVVFCRFGTHMWVLGLGEACGSYPAEPYYNDILVLKGVPEESTDAQIYQEIQRSTYFGNSFLIGLKDGNLGRMKGKFKERDFPSFVAQQKEVDSEYIVLSTLEPVVHRPTLWKEELIDCLVEDIIQVLSEG